MASRPEHSRPSARKAGARAILEAAERLFGQFGHEGVSIRQVNIAAGMANNSAVTYHFGGKAGLVRAIYEWRLPALEAIRARLVEQARRDERLSDPTTLIGILLRPHYALVDADGRRNHARFVHQMMRSPEGRAIRMGIVDMSPLSDFALRQLAAALPDIPAALLRYRLRLGTVAFLDTLCEHDLTGIAGLTLEEDVFVEELLEMVVAICARPLSPKLRAAFAADRDSGRVKEQDP